MPRRSAISSSRPCRCFRAPSIRSTRCRRLFRAVSHANPFFYVISGFRYGFLGAADSPVLFGALLLLGINVALGACCYALLRQRLEAEGLIPFIQIATIMNGFCPRPFTGAKRHGPRPVSANHAPRS